MAANIPRWEMNLTVPQCYSATREMTPKQHSELPSDLQGAGPMEVILLAFAVKASGSSVFAKGITLVWENLHSLLPEGPHLSTLTLGRVKMNPFPKLMI